jgi:hypothetical protein
VVLLGIDLKKQGHHNHWHKFNRWSTSAKKYELFQYDFIHIKDKLQDWPWRVEVLNASEGSALDVFPKVGLRELTC